MAKNVFLDEGILSTEAGPVNVPVTHDPIVFLQHDVPVRHPNAAWSLQPFNVLRTVKGSMADWAPADIGAFVPSHALIAAPSNGQVLPQATINVDNTDELASSGHVVIRVGTVDTLVAYSGKTATTLTGCTGGSGTLATGGLVRQATAVAVGSNGAILPQGTINVGSTAGFSDKGYLCIRASTLAGADTVVRYTGKTATQFTGCTFGTGTLATGDMVRQANVGINMLPHTVGMAVAEVAFADSGVGKRGLRYRFIDGFFDFAGGTSIVPAVAGAGTASDPFLHIQSAEQPAWTGAGHFRIEVFQNSAVAGGLNTVLGEGSLDAPRLVILDTSRLNA